MKKTNLSVGIAAYNEEKNIKNILADILKQKQDGCLSFKHLINFNLAKVLRKTKP